MFAVYQRGTLDLDLWMEFNQHIHLKEFITEQFPPLDFMNSFGQAFLEEYLRFRKFSAQTSSTALGVIASGKLARGAWNGRKCSRVFRKFKKRTPTCIPWCRQKHGHWATWIERKLGKRSVTTRTKPLCSNPRTNGQNIWPRWSIKACYLAFNLSDWATLVATSKSSKRLREPH